MRSGDSSNDVRLAAYDDLSLVARIHKRAYTSSHLTSHFPEDLLVRYYGHFIGGGCDIYLAVCFDGRSSFKRASGETVRGFVVCGTGVPQRIATFKKDNLPRILRVALMHPRISVPKALTSAFGFLRQCQTHVSSEFLILSVASADQRSGVGSLLLNSAMTAACERGLKEIGLYVNTNNIPAINAYLKAGFRIINCEKHQYYMQRLTTINV